MDNMEELIALCMCHCSLISADACPKSSNGKCTILDCATCLAGHLIDNSVVPVVRCKDCKHYNVFRLECHNGHMNGVIGIDGFCSYGERRE